MAYRTFDPAIVSTDTETEPRDDGFAFWRGLVNAIIPSLLGWLMIFGMGYVAWCLLPGGL